MKLKKQEHDMCKMKIQQDLLQRKNKTMIRKHVLDLC